MIEIGTKIKGLRQSKKMTQKELAEHLNVTPQAVSKWELNKSYPDLDTLVKLSNYFQVSTDKLLGNEKQSFFDALFSKKEGQKAMKKGQSQKIKQNRETDHQSNGKIPKAVKVQNVMSILTIHFDNGAIRYLRTHFNEQILNDSSLEGRKPAKIFLWAAQSYIGPHIEIEKDGTVIIEGRDRYTPDELWYNSKDHVYEL